MRINLVTQYYPPEIGAPQARLSEMANYWQSEGNEVSVFTCFPNHPTGILREEDRGKVFRESTEESVKVYRHGIYVTPNKGFIKKTLSHISFMLSFVFLSAFRGKKPDKYVVSSPTFFIVIGVWFVSKLRRVPFVFEVRDLWPGIFIELGVLKNKMLISILSKIELFLYRQASEVVVVSQGFKKDICDRGIDPTKVFVITNGVKVELFSKNNNSLQTLRSELGYSDDDFIVLYIGAHGISQGLSSIIESARMVSSTQNIKFLFVGEGADKEKITALSKEYGLKNISFNSGIPREQVPDYYHLSDVCLVPLKNIEGFKTFIPSKMFEIMATSTPIIASLYGESAEILKKSQSAIVVEPENEEAIANAILDLNKDRALLQSLGNNGLKFVEINYSRKQLALNYLEILNRK